MFQKGLVIGLLFVTGGCANASAVREAEGNSPVLGNSSLMISKGELLSLEKDAMGGSAEAARRLGVSYLMMSANDAEAWKWFCVGAENGDDVSMYNLWSISQQSKDELVKIRGEFWLKKAASLGHERAIQALRDQ